MQDFPIICEPCLGNSPFLRMTTQHQGRECKICNRLFKTYRWLPEVGARYRKTEICHSCARIKNICQTCLLDLEYGLQAHIRDAMIMEGAVPLGDANRLWYLRAAEEQMEKTKKGLVNYQKLESVAKETLKKMSKTRGEPYSQPKSKVCQDWLKGQCLNTNCKFQHEIQKQCKKIQESRTLKLINIPKDYVSEEKLREMYLDFNISSVVCSLKTCSALINFESREQAEKAMGKKFFENVTWARPQPNLSDYQYESMNPALIK